MVATRPRTSNSIRPSLLDHRQSNVHVHRWILLLLLTGCHTRAITVAAAGDLQLSSSEMEPIPAGLLDAEVKICNLESALTARGTELLEGDRVKFRAAPERAQAL